MKRNLTMIYAGLRLHGQDKVVQCFVHAGREYFWTGIRHAVLGGKFIAVQDGKNVSMNRAQFAAGHLEDNEPDAQTRQTWEEQDTAAREFRKQRREARSAQNYLDKHWDALRPLHVRCAQLNFFERRAFAEAVTRMVIHGKKAGGS